MVLGGFSGDSKCNGIWCSVLKPKKQENKVGVKTHLPSVYQSNL